MMRDDWKSVSVNKALVAQIERVLVAPDVRETGLTNTAQFVDQALREKLERIEVRRFSHIVTDGNSIAILDNRVKPIGRIVTVSFRGQEAWCDHCQETVCVHVQYVWVVPEIRKILKDHGLTRPQIGRVNE